MNEAKAIVEKPEAINADQLSREVAAVANRGFIFANTPEANEVQTLCRSLHTIVKKKVRRN